MGVQFAAVLECDRYTEYHSLPGTLVIGVGMSMVEVDLEYSYSVA